MPSMAAKWQRDKKLLLPLSKTEEGGKQYCATREAQVASHPDL